MNWNPHWAFPTPISRENFNNSPEFYPQTTLILSSFKNEISFSGLEIEL